MNPIHDILDLVTEAFCNTKMLWKALFLFGLAVVVTQAASIENVKIGNPSEQHVTKTNKEDIIIIVEAILRRLDVENIDEILCVLGVASVFDKQEANDNLDVILQHGPELINLTNERNELVKQCKTIGGEEPSIREVLQRVRCVADVDLTTGAQMAVLNLQFQSAITYFRDLANDLEECAQLIPETA